MKEYKMEMPRKWSVKKDIKLMPHFIWLPVGEQGCFCVCIFREGQAGKMLAWAILIMVYGAPQSYAMCHLPFEGGMCNA